MRAPHAATPVSATTSILGAILGLAAILGVLAVGSPAGAGETPIGRAKRITAAGIEVAAVHLPAIEMEPEMFHGKTLYLTRDKADIHLEADIHALPGNKQGFKDGEWIPGLLVRYSLKNVETGTEQSGVLHPMVADDGPHYGVNVKMMGLGLYQLVFDIEPPGKQHADAMVTQGVGRVGPGGGWWKPLKLEWTFQYLGPGKAGY